MIRLTAQQVKMLHRDVIAQSGGSPEIRDEGLLESALHAPFQTFAGVELYPTIVEKAAHLGYSLIQKSRICGRKQKNRNACDAGFFDAEWG